MKFSFIHAEKACFPVAALCRVLGVSRQGYYVIAAREPGRRERADVFVATKSLAGVLPHVLTAAEQKVLAADPRFAALPALHPTGS